MTFDEFVYLVMMIDTKGMDAIYEDYIRELVGKYGFESLKAHGQIECCAEINGRKLYVLNKNYKKK